MTIIGGPPEPPAPAGPVRLHARWTEVVWGGAADAPIAGALGEDILGHVDVIYQWLGETQAWRSYRPGAPPALSAFDRFQTGASYWIAVAEAVDWAVAEGDGSSAAP